MGLVGCPGLLAFGRWPGQEMGRRSILLSGLLQMPQLQRWHMQQSCTPYLRSWLRLWGSEAYALSACCPLPCLLPPEVVWGHQGCRGYEGTLHFTRTFPGHRITRPSVLCAFHWSCFVCPFQGPQGQGCGNRCSGGGGHGLWVAGSGRRDGSALAEPFALACAHGILSTGTTTAQLQASESQTKRGTVKPRSSRE